MKILLLLLSSIMAMSAFAEVTPQVGDFAIYQVTNPSREHEEKRILEEFDEEKNRFREVYYRIKDDEVKVLSERWEFKSLFEFIYISDLEDECKNRNGIVETITVKFGVFEACKLEKFIGGTVRKKWIAESIPFGAIKYENYSINSPTRKTTKELKDFGINLSTK